MASIKTFTTGVAAGFKAVRCHFEPQQDLHGYDKPWPAGGGVNILPNVGNSASNNGYTSTYDSETGVFTINGSLTGSSALLTLADIPTISWNENDYYALSVECVGGSITAGEGTGITWAFAVFSSNNAKFIRGSTTDANMTASTPLYYGRGVGFIASAYKLYLQVWRAGTVANNLKVKVQLEKIASASATPSAWSPYENLCPITGYDSVTVRHSGKNLCDVNAWEVDPIMISRGIYRVVGNSIILGQVGYEERYNRYILSEQGTYVFTAKIKTLSLTDSRAFVGVGINTRWGYSRAAYCDLVEVGHEGTISMAISSDALSISFGSWGYSGEVEISEIQLEAGSTPTTYEPFGESATVEFPVCGVNQWDEEWEQGRINTSTGIPASASGIRTKNFVPVKPSTSYWVASTANVYFIEYDENQEYVRYASYYTNQQYTTGASAHYVKFYQVNIDTYGNNVSLNYPAIAKDYYPASHVAYGGSAEVVSKPFAITRKRIKLKDVGWTWSDAGFFTCYASTCGMQDAKTWPTYYHALNWNCSAFEVGTTNSYPQSDCMITATINSVTPRVRYDRFAGDTVAFTAYLAGVDAELVYELAEPEIHAIPESASFTAYRGLNNVWHDLNGDIDVDYIAKDHATPAEYRNKILLNTPHIEEQSGDVAAFSTDIKGRLKGAEVTLVPEQDLNGYAYPWPAGGGKNLLHNVAQTITRNGVTFTVYEDGTVLANGTNDGTSESFCTITPTTYHNDYCHLSEIGIHNGVDYILNGAPTGSSASGYRLQLLVYGSGREPADIGNGVTFNFTDEEVNTKEYRVAIRVPKGVTVSNVLFKPMIRLASISDASFAPYANICPITGHTSAKVYDDPVYGGEIEFNQLVPNGNFASTANWSKSGAACDFTVSNNKATITIVNGQSYDCFLKQYVTYPAGHVFYFGCTFRINTARTGDVGFCIGYASDAGTQRIISPSGLNQTIDVKTIYTMPYTATQLYVGKIGYYGALDNDDTIELQNVVAYDLTQMFGAGNEPRTVSEFQALFPASYYPYNTGEKTTVSAVNGDPYWEAEVSFDGAFGNVWDEEWEVGAYNVSTGEKKSVTNAVRCKNLIKVTPNTTYYRVAPSSWQIQSYGFQYCYYDENMTFLRGGRMYAPNSATFTVPSDAHYMTFGSSDDARMSVTTIEAETISINYPASVTWYEPYETVTYGAKVNLATGECTVTDIRMHISRSTGMALAQRLERTGGCYFYKSLTDNHCSLVASQISIAKTAEHFTHGVIDNPYTEDIYCAWVYKQDANYSYVRVGLPTSLGIDTVEKFYTWLDAQGGVDVSYPLETPRTFYLTPQELQQLRGQNNIFSPDGQIKVRYWTH